MKLLITGASGFLGQYVVVNALRRGYEVRAVVRPHQDISLLTWSNHDAVEIVKADLAVAPELVSTVSGVDCVIHLVASKSSDFVKACKGTVLTTQNLLKAMECAQVMRLISISSFSVYDYSQVSDGNTLDESCPIETSPSTRDAYAQTKLMQEQLVREFASLPHSAVTILRPGMIYGREVLWNACHGAGFGPLWLLIGASGIMPVTYVENCADAIVTAVEAKAAVDTTLNIVDDELPTRKNYTDILVKHSPNPPQIVPVNWLLLRGIAQVFWFVNQRVLGGMLKLPGLLIPPRLDARLKPMTYSNQKAKEILNWHPPYSWQDTLERIWNHEMELISV
ncbi:NAD-dependent epimerase/dehydratase family protein [Calothrix rhizosoleniae]|uniref:NAD-dependent epimerase/dehydratase family protein n=1 Tax=Calothrix rhizosoleniae TaxID=888997 RepID=UPI000B4A0B0B|nr:NAD(P)-dependent oxidoreductase [Calothrix rhizosoleniae]